MVFIFTLNTLYIFRFKERYLLYNLGTHQMFLNFYRGLQLVGNPSLHHFPAFLCSPRKTSYKLVEAAQRLQLTVCLPVSIPAGLNFY